MHNLPRNQILLGLMLTTICCIPLQSARAQVRYLALGDSFTSGVGVRPQEAFPHVLTRKWRERGCAVQLENRAWGGRTAEMVFREQMNELERLGPEVVTLAVGANDIRLGISVFEYMHWVNRVLDRLEALGVPAHRIWVLPQPSWHLAPVALRIRRPDWLNQQRRLFNKYLSKEVVRRGMRFLDMSDLMHRSAIAGELSHDLFHPGPVAYAKWAQWMFTNLEDPCGPESSAPYRSATALPPPQ